MEEKDKLTTVDCSLDGGDVSDAMRLAGLLASSFWPLDV